MRLGLIIKLALLGALALVVALVAVAKSIDVSAYRDLLSQAAMDATGRKLSIDGRLSLRLSLNPALVARDVTLSNADWADKAHGQPMIKAGRVEANIGLIALLGRQVRIKRLAMEDADVVLERNGSGRGNWEFGQTKGITPGPISAAGTPTGFSLSQLSLFKVRVHYRDAASQRSDDVLIDRMTIDSPVPGTPVGVMSVGSWNGRHYDMSGSLGTSGEFMDFLSKGEGHAFPLKLKAVLPGLVGSLDGTLSGGRGGPYLMLKLAADSADLAETGKLVGADLPPFGAARMVVRIKGAWNHPVFTDVDATLGRRDTASLTIKGSIHDPLIWRGLDLLLIAEGTSLSGFSKPLGVALPVTGPLKGQTRLADVADGWRFGEIKAAIGRSDIAGEVFVRPGGKRPSLVARLSSSVLAVDELSGDGEEVEGKQAALFPDQPLPFPLLKLVDADLDWKIDRLTEEQFLAQQVMLSARLKDGVLSAQPSAGAVAGGKAKADLQVDVNGRQPQVQVSVDADKVSLGDMLRSLHVADAVRGGSSDVRLRLKGVGATPHAIVSRATGESVLVSGPGRLDGAYAGAMVLDMFHQLAPWSQEKDTDMQCLVSRFIITDGLAKSDALLLDTSRMTVSGQGSINLGSEAVDMTLSPRPKDAGLLSLSVPLDIQGTLAHPMFTPNKGAIVKGVASAVGGSGVLGAAVPLVSVGAGTANPCLAAVMQARKSQSAVKARKGAKDKDKSAVSGVDMGGLGSLLQGLIGK